MADFYGNAFPDAAASADVALDGSSSHAGGSMSVLVATAQVIRSSVTKAMTRCHPRSAQYSNRQKDSHACIMLGFLHQITDAIGFADTLLTISPSDHQQPLCRSLKGLTLAHVKRVHRSCAADRLQITNAEEVLRKCQDWMPPGSQRPARCEGTAFADGGMPSDVAALRRADILVRQL